MYFLSVNVGVAPFCSWNNVAISARTNNHVSKARYVVGARIWRIMDHESSSRNTNNGGVVGARNQQIIKQKSSACNINGGKKDASFVGMTGERE